MSVKRRILAPIATLLMAGTALIANAGVSQADGLEIYNFRLSNFAWVVANICVHTHTKPEGECTGKWAHGGSEVFQIPADSLEDWWCTADVVGAVGPQPVHFSRTDTKECYLDGDANYNRLGLK